MDEAQRETAALPAKGAGTSGVLICSVGLSTRTLRQQPPCSERSSTCVGSGVRRPLLPVRVVARYPAAVAPGLCKAHESAAWAGWGPGTGRDTAGWEVAGAGWRWAPCAEAGRGGVEGQSSGPHARVKGTWRRC